MRALVTGAAQGLGKALVEELLRRGYQVVAVDRDTQLLTELTMDNDEALTPHHVDLSNFDSIKRLLYSLQGQKFDLVILNAGVSATGCFEEIPVRAYDQLIAVNLHAPLYLSSQLVGGDYMERKSKIVFISSLSHAVGYPGAAVYAATKDAIAAYARCVAKPFKKQRVGVLTVFPGPINTEHARKHAPDNTDAAKRMDPKKLAKMILRAARGGSKTLFPGTKTYLAAVLGSLFPGMAMRAMRRNLFDKMDGPTY